MNEELIKIETLPAEVKSEIEKSGIDHKKANAYIGAFLPYFTKLGELEPQIDSINSLEPKPEDASKARDLRIQYQKNRTACEKEKDSRKKLILIEGNLIQSMYNAVMNASKMKEEHLLAVEKFEERKRAQEKEALKLEREALLFKYVEDVKAFRVEEMDQTAFDMLLEGCKHTWEKKQREAEVSRLRTERENIITPLLQKAKLEKPEGLDFGALPQDAWDHFLKETRDAVAEIEKAEALERERQKRTNDRMISLSSIGFTFIPERQCYQKNFKYHPTCHVIEYSKTDLEQDDDNKWMANLKDIHNDMNIERKVMEEEQAKKKKLGEARRAQLMACKYPSGPLPQSSEFLAECSEEAFANLLQGQKSAYENYLENERLRKEKEKSDKEKAEREAEEAAAEKRREELRELEASKGDKEKFVTVLNELKAFVEKPIEFKSKKYRNLYGILLEKIGDAAELVTLKNK